MTCEYLGRANSCKIQWENFPLWILQDLVKRTSRISIRILILTSASCNLFGIVVLVGKQRFFIISFVPQKRTCPWKVQRQLLYILQAGFRMWFDGIEICGIRYSTDFFLRYPFFTHPHTHPYRDRHTRTSNYVVMVWKLEIEKYRQTTE